MLPGQGKWRRSKVEKQTQSTGQFQFVCSYVAIQYQSILIAEDTW